METRLLTLLAAMFFEKTSRKMSKGTKSLTCRSETFDFFNLYDIIVS